MVNKKTEWPGSVRRKQSPLRHPRGLVRDPHALPLPRPQTLSLDKVADSKWFGKWTCFVHRHPSWKHQKRCLLWQDQKWILLWSWSRSLYIHHSVLPQRNTPLSWRWMRLLLCWWARFLWYRQKPLRWLLLWSIPGKTRRFWGLSKASCKTNWRRVHSHNYQAKNVAVVWRSRSEHFCLINTLHICCSDSDKRGGVNCWDVTMWWTALWQKISRAILHCRINLCYSIYCGVPYKTVRCSQQTQVHETILKRYWRCGNHSVLRCSGFPRRCGRTIYSSSHFQNLSHRQNVEA